MDRCLTSWSTPSQSRSIGVKVRTLSCQGRGRGSTSPIDRQLQGSILYSAIMPYADPDLQRKYQREWIKRRREEWIQENGPCVDCGSWDDPEVDHIDPATKVSHNVWSWSAERRAIELSKCVVRCHTHHMEKSCTERPKGIDHYKALLTEDEVRYIKYHSSEFSGVELARRFGVGLSCIYGIRQGRRWSHI